MAKFTGGPIGPKPTSKSEYKASVKHAKKLKKLKQKGRSTKNSGEKKK
jgi:hypothetical protein